MGSNAPDGKGQGQELVRRHDAAGFRLLMNLSGLKSLRSATFEPFLSVSYLFFLLETSEGQPRELFETAMRYLGAGHVLSPPQRPSTVERATFEEQLVCSCPCWIHFWYNSVDNLRNLGPRNSKWLR